MDAVLVVLLVAVALVLVVRARSGYSPKWATPRPFRIVVRGRIPGRQTVEYSFLADITTPVPSQMLKPILQTPPTGQTFMAMVALAAHVSKRSASYWLPVSPGDFGAAYQLLMKTYYGIPQLDRKFNYLMDMVRRGASFEARVVV